MDKRINEIIVNVNNAVKQLLGGNYIAWCGLMNLIVQQLVALRNEISNGGTENGEN